MDDIHAAHGTASIVEHPLLSVQVQEGRRRRRGLGVCFSEIGDNMLNDGSNVVLWRRGNSSFRNFMQVTRLEYIEILLEED